MPTITLDTNIIDAKELSEFLYDLFAPQELGDTTGTRTTSYLFDWLDTSGAPLSEITVPAGVLLRNRKVARTLNKRFGRFLAKNENLRISDVLNRLPGVTISA